MNSFSALQLWPEGHLLREDKHPACQGFKKSRHVQKTYMVEHLVLC